MRRKDDLTGNLLEGAVQDRRPGNVNIETKGLIDKIITSNEINQSEDNKKRQSILIKIYIWIIIRLLSFKRKRRLAKKNKLENNTKKKHCHKAKSFKIKEQIRLYFSRFVYPEKGSLRFFLLISTSFMMLLGIIWYTIYFINDVILWESEFHINEQGTINPRKSLNSDYSLFLFNTSEVWANPGIQVNKGDKIRINISGGFNSSIKDVLDDSRNNETIKYLWRYIGRDNLLYQKAKLSDRNSLKYCLSRDFQRIASLFKKKYQYNFGTILYTIQPASADIINHPLSINDREIYPWIAGRKNKTYKKDRAFHKAKKTGYLYFAINDLVFDKTSGSEKIEEYYDDYLNKIHKQDSIRKDALVYIKTIQEFCPKTLLQKIKEKITNKVSLNEKTEKYLHDTVAIICEQTYGKYFDKDIYESYLTKQIERANIDSTETLLEKTKVLDDPQLLYKDNLGQLLVAVEIQHHTPWSWLKPHMAFRWFERKVNALSDFGNGFWGYVIKIIGTVFIFLIFFIIVVCIFTLWFLICWLIVHVLYYFVTVFIDFIDYSSRRIYRKVKPKILYNNK